MNISASWNSEVKDNICNFFMIKIIELAMDFTKMFDLVDNNAKK